MVVLMMPQRTYPQYDLEAFEFGIGDTPDGSEIFILKTSVRRAGPTDPPSIVEYRINREGVNTLIRVLRETLERHEGPQVLS